MSLSDDPTGDVTELLQQMIRNRCVNDGTPESGQESRSVATLRTVFEGLPMQTYEPTPGRESLLVRIEGSDPTAATLMLMGHTDVVPVSEDGWSRDPFAGELEDGWVWGRGAIDMLNVTASMAIAVRNLARSGWRPRGTLLYLAVADEEAGGAHGAQWLTENALDDVNCTWCITESGGVQLSTPGGRRVATNVGEKGVHWIRLTVHGTPSHGSRPLHTDNALLKAAEVITRLQTHRPEPVFTDAWRRWVELMGFDPDMREALTSRERIWEAISELPLSEARNVHACTHLTVAPTVVHGGVKTNVIPDRVDLDVDLRKVPGQTADDVERLLSEALGELRDEVEVNIICADNPSESPIDTPLYAAMQRAAHKLAPDVTLLPTISTGGTDARFFRELGIPAYGFGLFSEAMSMERWSSMFHGNDERVDQESLRMTTELWDVIIRDVLA